MSVTRHIPPHTTLGHPVVLQPTTDLAPFLRKIADCSRASESALGTALRACDVATTPEAARADATCWLNQKYLGDPACLLRLSFALWSSHDSGFSGCHVSDDRATPHTPGDIEGLTTFLSGCALHDSSLAQIFDWYRETLVGSPVAYMQHMDQSGHGDSTAAIIAALASANHARLQPPWMEIGAGPGNIAWRLLQRQLIPPKAALHLVDTNPDWLAHAQAILRDYPHVVTHHQKAADVSERAGTVYTALTLQWFQEPQATIDAMWRNMAPGGECFFVGESPTNVSAPTGRGLYEGMDIGYSDGAFSYADICVMLQARGFLPMPQGAMSNMAMPDLPTNRKATLAEHATTVQLLRAYSTHVMIGTAWTKPA